MKRLAALALTLPLLGLAACGSSSSTPSADPSASASVGSSSDASLPDVQPCDGLDAAAISKVLGAKVSVDTGTADVPRCALVPAKKGDPVFDLNYQWWFSGGLDAAFQTMDVGKGQVSDVSVKGADAAKLVQQTTKKEYFITGFVENGDLIQVVNGEALLPYDKAKVLAATKLVLAQLSKSAPKSQS